MRTISSWLCVSMEPFLLWCVTTLSFDLAVLDLFLPLAHGGHVVVADRETAADPVLLAEAIRRSGCTVLQATPATWRRLIEAGWTGAPGLKAVCGGETMTRELADALLARGAAVAWDRKSIPECGDTYGMHRTPWPWWARSPPWRQSRP